MSTFASDDVMGAKRAQLSGPGMSTYEKLEAILPSDYSSILSTRDTQRALFHAKANMERGLCRALNLEMVCVPLLVESTSGMNDMLDRDGSRTPVSFHIKNDSVNPVETMVVQAATKWKRKALLEFNMNPGEGLITDMRAVRKDYFLDHDHSAYVDQWDWELAITREQRNIEFLEDVVKKIYQAMKDTEKALGEKFPALKESDKNKLPDELFFIHAEELLEKYPNLPRKERETAILKEKGAVFIYGIGWTLEDGFPHENRAADYDDWSTQVKTKDGKVFHGLNGDILVWNDVTQRRHELSSMGIRVDGNALKLQMKMCGLENELEKEYHQGILNDTYPLSIGGGIGQSRFYMYLLKKAHIGEVSVTVWPNKLKQICEQHNIHVLS
mmetsp:Transcript_9434/g.17017  ORF Transcript_9434/g.17017 Transcript_9434/m.17017 type:complete len:385 (-) Transcript_9434:300-1454(-)